MGLSLHIRPHRFEGCEKVPCFTCFTNPPVVMFNTLKIPKVGTFEFIWKQPTPKSNALQSCPLEKSAILGYPVQGHIPWPTPLGSPDHPSASSDPRASADGRHLASLHWPWMAMENDENHQVVLPKKTSHLENLEGSTKKLAKNWLKLG